MIKAKLWAMLLTASVPSAHGDNANTLFTQYCKDYACVERTIAEAKRSERTSRIRVFKPGDYTGTLMSGATPFPAFIDIQLQ